MMMMMMEVSRGGAVTHNSSLIVTHSECQLTIYFNPRNNITDALQYRLNCEYPICL